MRPFCAGGIVLMVTRGRGDSAPPASTTGRNFGYGSAAPAKAGTMVLDLRRMNRILEVSAGVDGRARHEVSLALKRALDHSGIIAPGKSGIDI